MYPSTPTGFNSTESKMKVSDLEKKNKFHKQVKEANIEKESHFDGKP